METGSNQQLQMFTKEEEEAVVHPILRYPLVRNILFNFLPDLNRHPERYLPTLEHISFYLLKQPKLRSDILAKELSEEFYEVLYGLKTQLKQHNLRQVSFAVEIHKQYFGNLLDEELER